MKRPPKKAVSAAALAKPEPDRLSRARAMRLGREGRVREAMALMQVRAFVRGKTYLALAEKWGVHPTTASDICSEAWRRHGAEITDPQRVRVKLAETLEQVIDDALEETREPAMIEGRAGKEGEPHVYQESPNGARRVVVEAAKTLSALVGSAELAMPQGWSQRSVEERWAAVDRAQVRLDAIRASLPPRASDGELDSGEETSCP